MQFNYYVHGSHIRFVEGGVHLGPSHAYITISDSLGFEFATFCVLGVRFTDASDNGCRLVVILPLSNKSRYYHAPPLDSPRTAVAQSGFEANVAVGVHLGPSHAYIPRSDSPGFEPANFSVVACALS
jgi:hypothetical protein